MSHHLKHGDIDENGDYDQEDESGENKYSSLDTPIIAPYIRVGDLMYLNQIVRHPIDLMTVLVQLGYEPLPPKISKTIFGRTRLQLPGIVTYLKHIYKTDGFFGLYRGFKYNVAFAFSNRITFVQVNRWQKNNLSLFEPLRLKGSKDASLRNLSLAVLLETSSMVVAYAVSYPFRVMMVRCMAQIVGRETHYDSVFGAIADIYQTGGVGGFYTGVVSLFLCEWALIVFEYGVTFSLNNAEVVDKPFIPFIVSGMNMIVRSLLYPLRVVSTVMSCNGHSARSLVASTYTAPGYDNWLDCYSSLSARGEVKRGASLIWRYQPLSSTLTYSVRPMVSLHSPNGPAW